MATFNVALAKGEVGSEPVAVALLLNWRKVRMPCPEGQANLLRGFALQRVGQNLDAKSTNHLLLIPVDPVTEFRCGHFDGCALVQAFHADRFIAKFASDGIAANLADDDPHPLSILAVAKFGLH